MTIKRRPMIIATIAVAALAGGGAAAIAAGGNDDDGTDRPITGDALAKAKAAALANTPGRVTATEVGDEEGYYEVEITRADGSQVDVHLDRDFRVLSTPADREEPGDD
jgi:uncharacterized membrane protein YkoI